MIIVAILVIILCIAYFSIIVWLCSKEEQKRYHSKDGEEALRKQKNIDEERYKKWKANIVNTLILRINDYFSSEYVLPSRKLCYWIKKEVTSYYYNNHQEEINEIISRLCERLSMSCETSPQGEKFYYKNKK